MNGIRFCGEDGAECCLPMSVDIFNVQRRTLNVTIERVCKSKAGTTVRHCQGPGGLLIWISLTEASQNAILFCEQVKTSYVKKKKCSLKADRSVSTPGFDHSIAYGRGCTDHSVHSLCCLWLYGSSYSTW